MKNLNILFMSDEESEKVIDERGLGFLLTKDCEIDYDFIRYTKGGRGDMIDILGKGNLYACYIVLSDKEFDLLDGIK